MILGLAIDESVMGLKFAIGRKVGSASIGEPHSDFLAERQVRAS
jgi:hypothetical protein